MSRKEKIAIGCDHAAFQLKEKIKNLLENRGFSIIDFGSPSEDSVDYPDMIHPLAKAVNSGEFERAIIMCGSGIGVSMVANKYQNVRCALCCSEELAKITRQHNDANILAIGARFVEEEVAIKMVNVFLETAFEGGRHQKRVDKIAISQ